MRIGRRQYPRLDEAQVFEAAFSDPRNATLVARLYQRPTPTSIYPMPREWLRGEGSQHAKSNSEATAYDELMAKAEEYREAHPELSISQAFEKGLHCSGQSRACQARAARERAAVMDGEESFRGAFSTWRAAKGAAGSTCTAGHAQVKEQPSPGASGNSVAGIAGRACPFTRPAFFASRFRASEPAHGIL